MKIGNAQPQPPSGAIRDNTTIKDHVRLELRGPDGKIKEIRTND